MLAAAGLAAILWAAAEPLLPLVFGPAVIGALPVLGILLVGQVIASSAGSQIYLLTMSGQEMLAAIVLIGFALADLVASVMLVPPFGLAGAAMATSAALIGMNIAMGLLVWRRLGVMPGSLGIFGARRNIGTRAPGAPIETPLWMGRRGPARVEVPARPRSMP
jgi:O-antigen/teichoic acid export membrane protein